MTNAADLSDTLGGRKELPPTNVVPIAVASGLLVIGFIALAYAVSLQKALLFLIGSGFGFALLHGGFGFTAGWRAIITRGDGRSLKMQLLVIAATMVAFIPILQGYLPGERQYGGLIAPISITLLIGAFMFGIGMQLSNGCGSGTLFTLGGGSKRMLFTLPAFIFGSLLATMHWSYWALPGVPAINLGKEFGVLGGIAVSLTGLAIVWFLVSWRENKMGSENTNTTASADAHHKTWPKRLWQGPWNLAWAAAALIVLNIATLLIGQYPWAVTYGFALWGANIAALAGVDVLSYDFWSWAKTTENLQGALVTNQQSVMNVGLILGAMLAAGLAGNFFSAPWPTWRAIIAALVGGLLMGYGARLSFGCNIGAFLGGIASGSVHGWVWFVSAFAGSLIGIKLRPFFDLKN